MSYDIAFVRPREGESLDEAFYRQCELEEQEDGSEPTATPDERADWERIATAVERELGAPERFQGEGFLQIVDGTLGLDLTLNAGGGAGLSIAYWHEGNAASAAMKTVARCVRIVESATGLLAYDPQTETAFRPDEPGQRAAAGLEHGHRMLREALRQEKRWWQFWR